MLVPIYTGEDIESMWATVDFENSGLTLDDIIVSNDDVLPDDGYWYPGAGGNIFADGSPSNLIFRLEVNFFPAAMLTELAGFDIEVWNVAPGSEAVYPKEIIVLIDSGPSQNVNEYNAFLAEYQAWEESVQSPKPVYVTRTLVSKAEMALEAPDSFSSDAGTIKYFKNNNSTTVFSIAPLSPNSKIIKNPAKKLGMEKKIAATRFAASNLSPMLKGFLQQQGTIAGSRSLYMYYILNGISIHSMANAQGNVESLEENLKKSSMGMDWFANKDNTNVRMGTNRFFKERSLVKERAQAAALYNDQLPLPTTDIYGMGQEMGGYNPALPEVSQTEVDITPKIIRKIEVPKFYMNTGVLIFRLIPLKSLPASTGLKWNSSTQSWQSADAVTAQSKSTPIDFEINASEAMTNLLRPTIPVQVSAALVLTAQRSNQVNVTLTARDPGVNAVSVTRKKFKKVGPTNGIFVDDDIDWRSDISLSTTTKKSIQLIDAEPLFYPHYREYISKSADGSLLDSAIVHGRPAPYSNILSADCLTIVASNGPNEQSGVTISICNIPPGYSRLRLLREDLSAVGTNNDRTVSIPSSDPKDYSSQEAFDSAIPATRNIGDVSEVSIGDTTAKLARRYRYFVALSGRSRPEVIPNTDSVIIRNWPVKKIPFQTSLSDPLYELQSDYIARVTINVVTILTEASWQQLNDLLGAQEFAGQYAAQIFNANNKKQFPMLAIYKITRVDILTGLKTFVGYQGPGYSAAVDDPFGVSVNDNMSFEFTDTIPLHPSVPGRIYYEFELCLRPPEAFLAGCMTPYSSDSTVTLPIRQAISAAFLEEWGYLGVTPSTDDIRAIGDGTMPPAVQFEKGRTGYVTLTGKFSTGPAPPTPEIFEAFPVNNTGWNAMIIKHRMMNISHAVDSYPIVACFLMVTGDTIPNGTATVQSCAPEGGNIWVQSSPKEWIGTREYFIVYHFADPAKAGAVIEIASNRVVFSKMQSFGKIHLIT